MADFEIRMLAMPEDIIDICKQIVEEYNIFFFAMSGQIGKPVNWEELCNFLRSEASSRYLYLFQDDPEEFYRRNPPKERQRKPECFDGKIFIRLPEIKEDGIERTDITARTFCEREIILWKKIFKDIRKMVPTHTAHLVRDKTGEIYNEQKIRVGKNAIKYHSNGGKLYELMFAYHYKISK